MRAVVRRRRSVRKIRTSSRWPAMNSDHSRESGAFDLRIFTAVGNTIKQEHRHSWSYAITEGNDLILPVAIAAPSKVRCLLFDSVSIVAAKQLDSSRYLTPRDCQSLSIP